MVYVHVMFNNDLKRIVVRGCDENDKDALRWCVAKPDKRKSRKMSCKPFATLVYQKMGWDSECRYKMLGYRITFEGETLYVFDMGRFVRSTPSGFVLSRQMVLKIRLPGTPSNPNS